MKYLMLGLITETGQQLRGPDLEARACSWRPSSSSSSARTAWNSR
jgi:hypothetical protein